MNELDRKISKTTIDPLINQKCRLRLNYMPNIRSLGIGLVSFFACTALGLAAADFKIRYNQKFPCLEVMDSNAVKITDVTEGAKGETVTSGKSSLNISFVKNSSGQPQVTLREAKSPLSEMEIEAFGLSVGLKPEGTVLVRFGADNKPKFEMDRTGGSRFLMADLGNLDTAAGKEVAENTLPSKNLIRCRERLAEWISGKGGWSNKSGKVLATQGGDRVEAGELPEREIKVSEAFQDGAKITVGSKSGMMFQSGAGVFHFALPGTVFSLGKLEAGSLDLKVELSEGTIQTFVAQALVAPRASLIALGNGEVVRTLDGAYQISKTSGSESSTSITTISGKVILAQEAGGKELATLSGEKIWSGSKGGEAKDLSANSPEKASLLAFEGRVSDTALIDIARDGVKACPEAVEEIVSSAIKAKPKLAKEIAEQCLAANPKFFKVISQASGVKGLALSKEEQAKVDAMDSLDQRLERLAIDGIDLEMMLGQVLLVEGDCKLDGKKEKILVGQVLALNDKIATGKSSRILVGMAPGVVLSVEAESVASLEKMSAEIKNGELQSREAVVKSENGLVVMNIAPWNKEKTDVRVKTTDGESVAQGTVFAVNFAGGKMMTTVTRGSVGSRDSSGKTVSIAAGQQAAPGTTPAVTPANSAATMAAGKAVESTISAMVANVAASVAATIPTAAAEVAAIAAKAVPSAAEQIAAAVAAKAPESAIAVAQAVSKMVPEAASKIAAAVIAATPGLDAKSVSAITAATSKGAAEAPSVDTASGNAGGNAGGVGAGGGGMGQAAAAIQVQQKAQDTANALKEALAREAAAKAELFNANEKNYANALEAYQQAVAASEAAKKAANLAQENLLAAQSVAAAADAQSKALAAAKLKSDGANDKIQGATTKEAAQKIADDLEDSASATLATAKENQETAATAAAAAQKEEAEAAARASVAAQAAQAAVGLKAAIDSSQTKAQADAAAEAARVAATNAKNTADAAATAATNAANTAKTTSTSTFNALTTDNKNLANEYKASNPAMSEPGVASMRSMFTPDELNKNSALKAFVEHWDKYIEKQKDKFAAVAEQAAKEAALVVAQQTEDAIKAATDIASAKRAAQAALTAANKEKMDKESLRIDAEKDAKTKVLADAKLKGEREAAETAKKAAADLAAAITAAADLAASKSKAGDAAKLVADALKAIEDIETAAKKAASDAATAAAEAAAKVPPVVAPPLNPNATPV
jgi:FecR protein